MKHEVSIPKDVGSYPVPERNEVEAELASDCALFNEEKARNLLGQMTCYQENPPNHLKAEWASPTFTHESRRLWGSGYVNRLNYFHDEYCDPTHFITIKFNEALPMQTIKRFHHLFKKRLGRFNEKAGQHIAGFRTLEIEINNHVHEHRLVRSTNDPRPFFEKAVLGINDTLGTSISLDYCEPVQCPVKASFYLFKIGMDQSPLLFARHLGMRFATGYGGYFFGHKVAELSQRALEQSKCKLWERQLEEYHRLAGGTP